MKEIEAIWVWVAVGPDGEEGVLGYSQGLGTPMAPMLGVSQEEATTMEVIAHSLREKNPKQPDMRCLKFTNPEVIEVLKHG